MLLALGVCAFLPPRIARGTVTGAAGALVRFKGSPFRARTDAAGRFTLSGWGDRVTAWTPGHFIAGAAFRDNPLSLQLRPLPAADNAEYAWVDPHPGPGAHRCGNCHDAIFQEWAGSAHGRAGTNRRFLNLYDGSDWHGRPGRGWGLLKDHPDGATVCAACHAPTVPFDHPGFDDFRKLDGVHARGVHCDYCHKIADAATDRLGLEHGRFTHRLLRPTQGQLFFGPLDDVDRDEDAYAPLYKESRYCAGCHEGTVFGIHVYTTYSEWLASPARQAGKQCQSCHMAPTGHLDNIAPGKGGIRRDPLTLASHAMAGGSPEMLKRCLRLTAALERQGADLRLTVTIRAEGVGHRVPTGFIDRHLILVAEGFDVQGQPVAAVAGPPLPVAAGDLAGRAGYLYGKQLEGPDGRRPVAFWQPSREAEDTRLAPEQPDRRVWTFAATAARVRVRLLYRRFYQATAAAKDWPENEWVVGEQTLAP